MTSIRKGFVGGGFDGGIGLPKQMALASRIEGADLIPDGAELFLGFTSTQKAGLGPSKIANVETLGYADLGPDRYFAHGTNMHLSHLFEDVAAWYLTFDFQGRLDTTFRPGLEVPAETQTVAQGPDDVQSGRQVRHDYARYRQIGHSGSVQPASRIERDVVGADGTRYPKGTAVPQRADFNTLDNPFFWTAYEGRDTFSEEPRAGLHFVVFNPSSDDFRRIRLAMDGVMPDGTTSRVRSRKHRPWLQLHPRDDTPSELPRAPAQSPLVPPFGTPRLSVRVIRVDHARRTRDTPDCEGAPRTLRRHGIGDRGGNE